MTRLTPHWTKTAAEAYGPAGVKGRAGEVLFCNVLIENHLPARDFEEEKLQQVSGVDVESNGYTIDVKSNLVNSEFFIEVDAAGWLFHPQKTSDLIVHIDVDTADIVWYTREAARANLRTYNRLLKITPQNFRPSFMSRSWEDLLSYLRS